jgi:hypothetical protein
MIVRFIGGKKTAILFLLLFLMVIVWEGVTKQVPATILLATGCCLAANLVCCMAAHVRKLAKWSLRQTGFIIFHAGLFVVILGGMITYYTYSIGYVEVAEGNGFTDQRSSYNGWKQRFGTRKGTGIQIGLKKINLSFWDNGQIKEYDNSLVIKDSNREREAFLDVNGSVRHRGLLINLARYYGIAPHFVLQTSHGRNEGYVYISDTNKTNTFTIPSLGYKATVVYGKITDRSLAISVDRGGKGTITRSIVPGDEIDLGDAQLKLTGISLWNGITVVSDSGKGITFAGFAMFIAGLLMYYLRFFREVSRNGRD